MAETKLAHAAPNIPNASAHNIELDEAPRRSPELQAEVEQIGQADTYLVLDRDEELFKWLDDLRDAKLCGYIVAAQGSGLQKTCAYYEAKFSRRRGTLLQIPAPVIYANASQHGTPTELYTAILEAMGHPQAHIGSLADLQVKTFRNLRGFCVKSLIIGNADYFSLKALNELVDIFSKLRISVVLVGTCFLNEILSRNHPAYVRIHDSFLESYEFPNLTEADIVEIVDDWEEIFIPSQRLNLTKNYSVKNYLGLKSGGLIEPLYDLIRKIAILKLDEPNFELNQENLTKKFGGRKEPRVKVSRKK